MEKRAYFTGTALAGAVLIGLGAPSNALAADAAAPGPVVSEVVVTAMKRSERFSQVAMPISAVTGAQLEKSNANSLADYITRLPGVVFNDYQPGVSEVIIRGISATTYHEQGQTTTGYYLNDIALVEPGFPIGIPDIDTFDLDRVEVLRGPQGTLFGSSSLGGLVDYIAKTADPSGYGGAIETLVGGTYHAGGEANYAVKAMINLPIIKDKLGVRLMALQRYDAGYLDNPGTGVNGSNDFRTRGLRGSVVFEPVSGTKITYLSTYQDTHLADQTYLNYDYVRVTQRAEPQSTGFWLNSLRLDQDVGIADLTAIVSNDHKTNTTQFSYPYAYVTGDTTGAAAAYDLGHAHADLDTFEVRLASKPGDRLKWLIGASYIYATKDSVDHIYQSAAAAYIDANPASFGGYPGSVLAPGDSIYGYTSDTTNHDVGVFGEVSYKFLPQWELTAGGRYYYTRNSGTIINAAGSLGPGSYSPTDATFGVSQSEDGFTPKVTLAFRPNGQTTIYATYSQGYRVGGPNPNAAILAGIPKSYGSDTDQNYEVGAKTTLFNNRLSLDATAFHIDWKNIQARLFTSAPYYYSYVTNAGGASVDGVEFFGRLQIVHDLSFSSSVTYQDAHLTKFLPDTFAVDGGYPAGTILPGSSRWAVANTLSLDLAEVALQPTFELAHRYLSSAPVAFGNPNTRGNFNVFDARASVNLPDNIRVLAFVNNLSNEYGILNAPFTAQSAPAYTIVRPRTFGVRMDWSF